ncbi:unnamed protein product [Urochloa humidicola]
MDFIPGDAGRRPDRVVACAARTAAVREAERSLQLCGIIAVQLDSRVRLTCEVVLRDALLQLGIPESALQVSRISITKFLLRFARPELRNAALARRGLSAAHTTLHLMPWSGPACASTSSKLPYRARICLEGVPDHAHQIETVTHLLPKQSFVEGIDLTREKEDERGCFILWVWCKDPEALCVAGTLKLEEPLVLPEEYYNSDEDFSHLTFVRSEELSVLEYEGLLHLDRVEDFSPQSSSSVRSLGSDVCGLPFVVPSEQWPARHYFAWHLGEPDRLADPPRLPVHARLGAKRDRSPPRGGGGLRGLYQVPPPNQFDMSRGGFRNGAGTSTQRDFGGGGHYRYRAVSHGAAGGGVAEAGRKEEERVKLRGNGTGGCEEIVAEKGKPVHLEGNDCFDPAVPFQFRERSIDIGQRGSDPMLDELTGNLSGANKQNSGGNMVSGLRLLRKRLSRLRPATRCLSLLLALTQRRQRLAMLTTEWSARRPRMQCMRD